MTRYKPMAGGSMTNLLSLHRTEGFPGCRSVQYWKSDSPRPPQWSPLHRNAVLTKCLYASGIFQPLVFSVTWGPVIELSGAGMWVEVTGWFQCGTVESAYASCRPCLSPPHHRSRQFWNGRGDRWKQLGPWVAFGREHPAELLDTHQTVISRSIC